MNYLRKIVSGKRRRFQDTQFDLDMTYITPRVIGMSYPASGYVETTYRNPIAKVAKFLKERHGDKYWIFNCSERSYDKTHFDQQVSDFLWKDHHPPTLHLLYAMVKAMFDFLKKDSENVIVVHCNSGKGRTGTAIATLLLYSGFVDNIDDALKFYGWKRFSSGIGVTQPCQLRTIYYFEAVLRNIVIAPCAKKLKAIVFQTVPKFYNDGCKPFFEITNNEFVDEQTIYNSSSNPLKIFTSQDKNVYFEIQDGEEPVLCGDVLFLFKHRGKLMDNLICRVAINTAFIPPGNSIMISKDSVSPDKVKKDSKIDPEFKINFVFEDYCQRCNKPWGMPLDEFCEKCREKSKNDITNWRSIHMVKSHRSEFTIAEGEALHYDKDEMESLQMEKKILLDKNLHFDKNNYKIIPPSKGLARLQLEQSYKLFKQEEEKKSNLFEGFDDTNRAALESLSNDDYSEDGSPTGDGKEKQIIQTKEDSSKISIKNSSQDNLQEQQLAQSKLEKQQWELI